MIRNVVSRVCSNNISSQRCCNTCSENVFRLKNNQNFANRLNRTSINKWFSTIHINMSKINIKQREKEEKGMSEQGIPAVRTKNYIYFVLNLIAATTCLSYSALQGYSYFFVYPDPLNFIWNELKDDPWLQSELKGGPLKRTRNWSGYVNEEAAKLQFEITGKNSKRKGVLNADLIRTRDGTSWELISVKFGRTDEEAMAEGIAVDPREDGNTIFTSKDTPEGPIKSSKVIPNNWVPVTDDMIAAALGYSVGTDNDDVNSKTESIESTPSECPYKH